MTETANALAKTLLDAVKQKSMYGRGLQHWEKRGDMWVLVVPSFLRHPTTWDRNTK